MFYTSFSQIHTQSAAFNERNDCAVKAVAIATESEYRVAHQALATEGRRPRGGTATTAIDNAVRKMGFTQRTVDVQSKTVRTLDRELKSRFRDQPAIIWMRGHVAGWNGQEIIDWTEGRMHRVRKVTLIEPINAPATPITPKPVSVRPKPAARKRNIHPQPEINRKQAALAAHGAKMVFQARKWTLIHNGNPIATMTSAEFAAATANQLVSMI